jgi:hypothetical protein
MGAVCPGASGGYGSGGAYENRSCRFATCGADRFVDRWYWGESIPYNVLDVHALRYHTVEQAIADFARFAQLVELPFDTNESSNHLRAVSGRQGYQR